MPVVYCLDFCYNVLTTGRVYTPAGTELQELPDDITVISSPHRLMVDGQPINIAAYNINGYNYFRLRDLAILLDFAVKFDGDAGKVTLDLTNPYSE